MFVQYLLQLNIKFVQYYVCVNVSYFVCVLTKIKKIKSTVQLPELVRHFPVLPSVDLRSANSESYVKPRVRTIL